jgi:hypothetical protein
VYEVTATALDGSGAEVARVRAISGYRPHKALLLALTFDDACIGKVADCDETQTCKAGKCVDAHVDVGSLLPFSSDSDGNERCVLRRLRRSSRVNARRRFERGGRLH